MAHARLHGDWPGDRDWRDDRFDRRQYESGLRGAARFSDFRALDVPLLEHRAGLVRVSPVRLWLRRCAVRPARSGPQSRRQHVADRPSGPDRLGDEIAGTRAGSAGAFTVDRRDDLVVADRLVPLPRAARDAVDRGDLGSASRRAAAMAVASYALTLAAAILASMLKGGLGPVAEAVLEETQFASLAMAYLATYWLGRDPSHLH